MFVFSRFLFTHEFRAAPADQPRLALLANSFNHLWGLFGHLYHFSSLLSNTYSQDESKNVT